MSITHMKNMLRPGFVGRDFRSGYRFQRHWDTPMATAFFCGETGAGLFIISMLLNFIPGIFLGLVITGVGKTFFHLTHMGVPHKSWRAILRPDRSWISRGLWGIIFFVGFGSIHLFDQISGILPEHFKFPIFLLALAGALVVVVYQGFAMSHSSAIPLWNTGLMPVTSMLYGLLGGVSLVVLMGELGMPIADQEMASMLVTGQVIVIVALLMALVSLLHGAKHGTKGAQQSYELLMCGGVIGGNLMAKFFVFGVIVIGAILPLLALLLLPLNFMTTLIITGCILFGFYLYRVLVFKAGVLDPILNPANGLYR